MRVLAWPAFKLLNENPILNLLYARMANLGVQVEEFSTQRALRNRYDIWHIHWPEGPLNNPNVLSALAKTRILLFLMDWVRARGAKTVWTMHNLSAHERLYPLLETRFWKAFTCRLDGCISPSKAGLEAAQKRSFLRGNLPTFVIPLGHYRGVYPDRLSSQAARALLAIPPDAKVILFFGYIRPYKGVPQLIRAFQQFPDPKAVLYIVGRPNSSALAKAVEREADLDPRIRLHLQFVPKDEVQMYLRAADLVILPFHEILNSASALLALSFDRPVLVPSRGALSELQAQVGEEWVRTYPGEIAPPHIGDALKWALNASRPAQAPLEVFGWEEIAKRTVEAYSALR